MTARDAILARLRLAERDEESIPLGATIKLRELTRAQFRDASAFARTDQALALAQQRGQLLAASVRLAAGDAAAIEAALSAYYLDAGSTAVDGERWNAAILAGGAVDPETGEALFTREEILAWPNRRDVLDEIARLAQAILDLSAVGIEPLKNESAPSSPPME